MNKVIKIGCFLFALFFLTNCEDLSVPNENEPDAKRLLNTPSDLEVFAEGAYYNYWNNAHGTNNIGITALVMADQYTASWANFGWLLGSFEPRLAWDNSPNANDDNVLEDYYFGSYAVITQANLVLKKILNDNIDLGKNRLSIIALSYFIQGISYGNIALVFDSAAVFKEDIVDATKVKQVSYPEVQKAAIESLEKAISYCDSTNFVLPGKIFNSDDVSNSRLRELCHSYIARYLVLTSRNKSENGQIDWNTVVSHSSKGITTDFGSNYNGVQWNDINMYYLNLIDWARIDCRFINLLDPEYPKRYPANGKPPKVHFGLQSGKARSIDKRLESDFEFLSSVNFKPERGYYHFSHYRYKRFDEMLYNNNGGMMVEFRSYENHLYTIEGLAYSDVISGIVELNIPSNPRYNRGNLPLLPLSSTKAELLKAIFYEREVELLGQGFMVGFCDMRRRDMLQYGTPLHFPIPGKELETLEYPNYTYGGIDKATGVNTSNGGWDE